MLFEENGAAGVAYEHPGSWQADIAGAVHDVNHTPEIAGIAGH
jgi:hypothetical protein